MSWPNIPGWIHSLFFSIMTSQRKWKEPFFLVLLLVLVKITRYLKKLTDIFEKNFLLLVSQPALYYFLFMKPTAKSILSFGRMAVM